MFLPLTPCKNREIAFLVPKITLLAYLACCNWNKDDEYTQKHNTAVHCKQVFVCCLNMSTQLFVYISTGLLLCFQNEMGKPK